jgi:diguanylate cyclase (GGDEF)-like protein
MAGLKFWQADDANGAPLRAAAAGASSTPHAMTSDAPGGREAVALVRAYEESGLGWFWSTDAKGNLTYLTSHAAGALRTGRDTLVGQSFIDLFERDEDGAGTIRTLPFLLAKQTRFEKLILRTADASDGQPRLWSVSGTPQFDAAGSFTGFRGNGMDVTEDRLSSRSVTQLALSDALTGLPNRLRASQVLQTSLAGIEHHKRSCAVMMMDLDRFKQVNDTLGHPAGDALLKQVSDRLARIVGEGEKVFRLGGDEFQIVLRDVSDRGELARIAEEIITLVSQPYSVEGSRCIIGASIGLAVAPCDGTTADELIRNADLALYAVKDSGRGRYRFFENELLEEAEGRRALENDLRDALANGELELAYQPIVDASTNRPTGVEALVRWRHPVRGPISPGLFIPIAEEANLIEPLGEWILRQACQDAMSWPGNLRVAVNVSPIQFVNDAFPSIVMSALAEAGLPAHRLELEITEGVFLGETSETDGMFATLKNMGVRLALDDFGTGYSSLSYLKTAPFDKIKIDQSFVRQATLPGSRNGAIIAAIVALAEALGMETTAEGIESLDQLDLCRTLRVSHVQGFVYSPGIDNDSLQAKPAGGDWTIEPAGPAKQRSTRHAMFRRAGAIYGNYYKSILIRNLSESGALTEGLPELAEGTLFLIDFGHGEIAFARVRRGARNQHGVEFEVPLASDGNGGFCVAHRVTPYLLATVGLPGTYPDSATVLDPARGGSVGEIADKLGLGAVAPDGAPKGDKTALLGFSLANGKSGTQPALARDAVQRLVQASRESHNTQLKHVVELLVLTGARQRELLEARWEHIDLDKGVWFIPDATTRKLRTVRLPAQAADIIRDLARFEECPNLIVNPATRQPYRSFASSWDTARKKAGLPTVEIDELRNGEPGSLNPSR